jgi:hypothetical protein
MNIVQKALAKMSCFFLKFLPIWMRLWIFWGPLVRGQFGLVQVKAGETEAVHEQTLAAGSYYVCPIHLIILSQRPPHTSQTYCQ